MVVGCMYVGGTDCLNINLPGGQMGVWLGLGYGAACLSLNSVSVCVCVDGIRHMGQSA